MSQFTQLVLEVLAEVIHLSLPLHARVCVKFNSMNNIFYYHMAIGITACSWIYSGFHLI